MSFDRLVEMAFIVGTTARLQIFALIIALKHHVYMRDSTVWQVKQSEMMQPFSIAQL